MNGSTVTPVTPSELIDRITASANALKVMDLEAQEAKEQAKVYAASLTTLREKVEVLTVRHQVTAEDRSKCQDEKAELMETITTLELQVNTSWELENKLRARLHCIPKWVQRLFIPDVIDYDTNQYNP